MTTVCIERLKGKLAALIESGAPYGEILSLSQRLDRIIVRQQRRIGKGATK